MGAWSWVGRGGEWRMAVRNRNIGIEVQVSHEQDCLD